MAAIGDAMKWIDLIFDRERINQDAYRVRLGFGYVLIEAVLLLGFMFTCGVYLGTFFEGSELEKAQLRVALTVFIAIWFYHLLLKFYTTRAFAGLSAVAMMVFMIQALILETL